MSVVYFLQFGAGGPVKVGTARDVGRRIKALDCGPERLTLLGTVPGGQTLEKQIHSALSRHRKRLEWFHPTPQVLGFVERALAAPEAIPALIDELRQANATHLADVAADALVATAAANWAVDRICDREGLSCVAAVAGVSDDQISKYRRGNAKIGVVALLRMQAAWPEDFALFELILGAPHITPSEVRDNRATLEAARDAIDAQLRKLVTAA